MPNLKPFEEYMNAFWWDLFCFPGLKVNNAEKQASFLMWQDQKSG